jgi:hypothetical protein
LGKHQNFHWEDTLVSFGKTPYIPLGNTYIFIYVHNKTKFFATNLCNISLFSSPCQRQSELLPALGVRRQDTLVSFGKTPYIPLGK